MSDCIEVEPGVWSVLDGTRVHEVRVAGAYGLIDGLAVEITVEDAPGWRPKKSGGSAGGPLQIRATMPGKIVRVLVRVDDQVAAGQGVVIVEAMKMQNEMKSPREGRVTQIAAAEHATVEAGAVLLTIE